MTGGTPKKKPSRRSGKLPEPLRPGSVDSQDNPSTLDVSSVREIPETQFVDMDSGPMDGQEEEEPDPVYQQVQEIEDAMWNVQNDIGDLKELDRARNRQLEKRDAKLDKHERMLEKLTTMMADLTGSIGDVKQTVAKLVSDKGVNQNTPPAPNHNGETASLGDDSPSLDLNSYPPESPNIQGNDLPVEPTKDTSVPGGNSPVKPDENQRTFSLGHRDWVAQLMEEAQTAEFNPSDDAKTPRPPTTPVVAQIRLPAGLPTFGAGLSTDIPDVIDYANLMETRLYSANLEPDDFGCRAVTATVGPRLSNQIMRHATYKGKSPNWRATVYWLLKLAPKAMSETEAQMLLEEIRMHNFDSAADFVSAFEALRFRAGPRLGKENATELLFRAVGKTQAMYIQQMAHTTYGRHMDICQLENELMEAQLQQWLIEDDEFLMRKQQQHMARLHRQYQILSKPLNKETHGFEYNECPKFQQQKSQNQSGLFNKHKENCPMPAVKQIELQEMDEISADE
ncbi:hypothetical protein H4R20_006259 [Coemansia guatemalensis]|uniref:Uncharacterized protein n=1 Tax=Coemansia guatemalensis TaxID=2761395 RepID=A0A9W8HNX5_9FUNG|nr:hypothetical protein H4R20_006259 [Coemansia guatemalensis]